MYYNNQVKKQQISIKKNYKQQKMDQRYQKANLLNTAIKSNNKQMILNILAAPDIQIILKTEDQSKYTPLFWACSSLPQNVGLQVVKIMLEKGADPYKLDMYHQNILYYISKSGKDKLLKFILERYKYDLNTNDYTKQTPLFFAAAQNHMKCAQLLVQYGADINHIDQNGQNSLFWAAGGGHLEICKFLVQHNIDFNLKDGNKQLALHYAKKKKHQHVINYLADLKQVSRKARQTKQMSMRMQSSQQEQKGRKKKQLMKQQYCLIYTNQKGQVHQLAMQQLQRFGSTNQNNRRILDLIYRPQKLQSYPMPEQKKFQKVANKIITYFMKHQQGSIFLVPVDPIALNIPHYPNIIKHPMDFTTIKTKLAYNAYDSQVDFNADMNLVFDNCVAFNGPDSAYGKIATQMRLEFNTMYKKQFGL